MVYDPAANGEEGDADHSSPDSNNLYYNRCRCRFLRKRNHPSDACAEEDVCALHRKLARHAPFAGTDRIQNESR